VGGEEAEEEDEGSAESIDLMLWMCLARRSCGCALSDMVVFLFFFF